MQVSISSMFSEDVNHFIVKLCAFSETHTVLSWFHVVEIGSPLAYEDLKSLLQDSNNIIKQRSIRPLIHKFIISDTYH